LKALAEVGWIAMLWAAYFMARHLIIGEDFNQYGKWLFMAGSFTIILFTNPGRNIFKGIGSGIGGLLLNAVNSFTDVVSYIRLFAVGAASIAVADAFNSIAGSMGYGSFLSGFASALILLFGHALNITLGAMAVLVHGLRLNMLEFSSHLGMEWSGVEYTPFKQEVN
jgi:V/A-type H+-transporting ATPase subunit I